MIQHRTRTIAKRPTARFAHIDRIARAGRPTRESAPDRTRQLLAATIADAEKLPAFALILEGNSLAPDFLDGDLLTVATDALPLPGDCVIARVGIKYRAMRLSFDGHLWDNNGGSVPAGRFRPVGVVVDRIPRVG